MKNSIFWFMAILLILVACGKKKNQPEESTISDTTERITLLKNQIKSGNILIGYADSICFHDRIITHGKIAVLPEGKISISLPFPMILKNVHVKDGDQVKKNQILFTFEGMELIRIQQNFAEVYFKYVQAENDYNRAREQVKNNIISQREFQQFENNYFAQKIQYQSLYILLEKIGINPGKIQEGQIYKTLQYSSPVNGYIELKDLSRQMIVEANQVVAEIYDISQMIISIPVFEKDVSSLKIGDTVFFYRLNNKDVRFKALLSNISKVVNTETHTVTCYARPLINSKDNLFINSFVQVEIIHNDRFVQAVPEEAIIKREKGTYIYELESITQDSTFVFIKKKVQVGKTDQGFTEVFTPLQKKLILKGTALLQ